MKKLSLLLFLLSSISVLAQSQYPVMKDSIINPGIYRTFAEFRNNKPTILLNHKIISDEVSYGGFGSSNSLTAYAIDIPKKEGREIGEVFGFSDGKNFYFIASEYTDIYFPNKIHNFNFYKVESVGKYCYYDAIQNSGPNSGTIPTRRINVLNMDLGEIKLLSKSYLKELLSEKPELLERFKKQENKYQHLKEYLIEFLKVN
ncbi:hypothetical protein [Flavobacterium sp. GT3R68]|uniref:hypothetical protein n=1 Tax=Flavobacterium sp. GT3R68 TaxID=2594437 RepID=UPI000F88777C|nr:hypothetical protein [Flavobacterium sp. GT3R68]RTY91361.1 hypothetical protein EKL32_19225 [Flavobacterium sp. GSN2]TRW93987.1 hypothetical protein FNW07_03490 [Flavobacterium sp. GT3R68]